VKDEEVANNDGHVEEDEDLHGWDVSKQVVQLAQPWRKGSTNVSEHGSML
jgi:hypothetical protein